MQLRDRTPWSAVGVLLTLPFVASAKSIPENEPLFHFQWGLHNVGQEVAGKTGPTDVDINAPEAWAIHSGVPTVVVAVVGTGVNPHVELASRLLPGRATVGDPYDTLDPCSHGTHAAGIIAAASDNGIGIAGVNDNVRILPVRMVDDCVATASSRLATALGIVWAVDQHADIVLVPVGFFPGSDELADAIDYAVNNDVLVIAPTGDAANGYVFFPAAYEGCLAVSAITRFDGLAGFSNYGPETDLCAPGEDILSTWQVDGYDYRSSTASAAAFTAGVAALMLSYSPEMTAAEVAQILVESTDDIGNPGWDSLFGAGRLNAQRALLSTPPPALRFEHNADLPTTVLPGSSPAFVVRVAGESEEVVDGTVGLFHRVGPEPGVFSFTSASPLGEERFVFRLPSLSCEEEITYYLSAQTVEGTIVRDPLGAPEAFYRAEAIRMESIFSDDFEENRGWDSVPAECTGTTTGCWTRVVPVGTTAQPGFDFSPGTGRYCYVTGQHYDGNDGTNDVDGGPVVLLSPTVDLNGADAQISYARWFHSSLGTPDFMTVEFTRDGGDSWVLAETVTTGDIWEMHSFRLSEFPEAIGDRLQLRFTTQDPAPGASLTEAAIDEFEIRAIQCSSEKGDFNGDNHITLDDFAHFPGCMSGPVTDFDPPGNPCAFFNFDDDLDVDLDDFMQFQGAFVSNLD